MRIIGASTIIEVFNFMGGLRPEGIVEDYNVSYLSKFHNFLFVDLSEAEFWDLIFLDTWEVEAFYPESSSSKNRRLISVAEVANSIGDLKLSDNWDIKSIRKQTREFLNHQAMENLPAIVLIPYEGGYYIQDGNHRCLGMAMAILNKKIEYRSLKSYVAIDER